MPRRYAYITMIDLSIDNGPGINERELAEELIGRYSDRVTCFMPRPSNPENHHNEQIRYVLNHKKNPLLYPLFLLSMVRRVMREHKKKPFDALVSRPGVMPVHLLLLRRLLGIPVIIKKAGGKAMMTGRNNLKLRLARPFNLYLYKRLFGNAAGGDTESAAYLPWIGKTYSVDAGKFRVIKNGANTEYFKPVPAGENPVYSRIPGLSRFDLVLGYAGALARNRHNELLLKALALLEEHKNVGVMLVGDGEQKEELKKLAVELGVESSLILTGRVPYSEVVAYINAFDVGVDLTYVEMPANGETYFGSYSQKIPQYLSCGLPVLAWDIPDNHFIVEKRIGHLAALNAGDRAARSAETDRSNRGADTISGTQSSEQFQIESLAETIEELRQIDPGEFEQMKKTAREYTIRELSAGKIADKRVELWDSLTESH